MTKEIQITISGPQGVGKSLLAEAIKFDLGTRGFNGIQVDEVVSDRATPGSAPNVTIVTTNEKITTTELGLPAKGVGLNRWIDDQVDLYTNSTGCVPMKAAGEIARGAALFVIADKATLIANLQKEGYRVQSPFSWPLPDEINAMSAEVHADNVAAGWWSDLATGERIDRNVGELLMLVVSELAEGAEGYEWALPDDKLPGRQMVEVELADTKIRVLDVGGGLSLDLGGAMGELMLRSGVPMPADHATVPERLMLIVRDVAAAMEGHRKGSKDEVLPHRLAIEVRLAAVLIGLHRLAYELNLDLDGAVAEKRAFNASRLDHKPENRKLAGGKAY